MNQAISVVIPTYNRARAVVEAVRSVLAQTQLPGEIIIVDDGSTDGTEEALRKLDAPISYVAKENGGVSSARNAGIRAARGEWIAFLDSDDRWEPTKLERQMDFVRRTGCKVCFTGHVVSDGERFLAGKELAKQQPDLVIDPLEAEEVQFTDPLRLIAGLRNHPLVQSMVAKRAVIEKAGLFDESLIAGEDTRFVYNLAMLSAIGYLNLPLVTITRRASAPGLTRDLRPAFATEKYAAYVRVHSEIYWRLVYTNRPELGVLRERLGYYLSRRAEMTCACRRYKAARSWAKDGLLFARDFRTVVRCVGILCLPALVGGRFRRKHPGRWDAVNRVHPKSSGSAT